MTLPYDIQDPATSIHLRNNDADLRQQVGAVVNRNAMSLRTISIASNTTLDHRYNFVLGDTRGSAVTITLPYANYWGDNRTPRIMFYHQFGILNITIAAQSGDTIDGLSNLELLPGQTVELMSDGDTKWFSTANRSETHPMTINVMDYGAVADGTTDDFDAIMDAITAAQAIGAGTYVWFPTGTYAVEDIILIEDVPVYLKGANMPQGAFAPFPATDGTTIKYTGSAGGADEALIRMRGMQSSGGIIDMSIAANNLLEIAVAADTLLFHQFQRVQISGATKTGLLVYSDVNYGSTCSWNLFQTMLLHSKSDGIGRCIWVTGDTTTNTCHNTFMDITINYGSSNASRYDGILLGCVDNNRFYNIFENRVNGNNGYGVVCDPTELAGFPVGNVFYHLQAGDGGWYQPANTEWNSIYGYQRDNGQPLPTITAPSKLLWCDHWGRWNTLMTIGAGAAGGGDPTTAAELRNAAGNAAVTVGYQNGSYVHADADEVFIRDSSATNRVVTNSTGHHVAKVVYTGLESGVFFGKAVAAKAADADHDITTAGSGLYIVRNLSDGGTALVLIDMGLGTATEVSDPAAIVTVGADPGAGSNQLWVTVTGTTVRVRNRYGAAKDIGVTLATVYGTPA